ncbi:hypothetical protein [Protaetiibacter larvae]|uniref:Glycosyltransferase family 1 protein n=1 Tax=Protaetiibacter larvae TaxID=2592654 RepID=A0A5C1Y4D2_9MICO|nr:hypothetical protein [Protaetiibacter larvae]QEO08616.1 hypothetical protein FLP23_00365 [Protaetiibacter larvae]
MVKRVDFVFDPDWPHIGSTVMRGEQLSGLARAGLGRDWRVRYRPLGARIRGSRVFLTKNAARRLDADDANALVRAGNRLFVDIVDSSPPGWTADVTCILVAASHTSFTTVSRTHPHREVVLIDHHVDPRLPAPPAHYPRFRVGYFGEVFNAALTPEVERKVEVVPVSTAQRDDSWLSRLVEFPLHFAVRRRIAQDDVKPFLKGFTAAAMGANILALRTDREAVAWLGDDYPFLVDGDDEATVLDAIAAAEGSWGSSRWDAGLHAMRGIRERVSPERIVRQLERALSA